MHAELSIDILTVSRKVTLTLTAKQTNVRQPLVSKDFPNKHVSTATRERKKEELYFFSMTSMSSCYK
jgi:hypothetical protein